MNINNFQQYTHKKYMTLNKNIINLKDMMINLINFWQI